MQKHKNSGKKNEQPSKRTKSRGPMRRDTKEVLAELNRADQCHAQTGEEYGQATAQVFQPDLRRCRYQRIAGSEHHEVLPHLWAPVLHRVQRLWIHSPQPGQLVGIDPIILSLAPF